MSFLVFLLSGLLGGVLGGMGLGGGTVLIPLLTIACGVPQNVAQGINLLAFLPMAALALRVHAGNGLLELKGVGFLVVPALVFSVSGAVFAAFIPSKALGKAFGAFLVVLSFFWLKRAFVGDGNRKKK